MKARTVCSFSLFLSFCWVKEGRAKRAKYREKNVGSMVERNQDSYLQHYCTDLNIQMQYWYLWPWILKWIGNNEVFNIKTQLHRITSQIMLCDKKQLFPQNFILKQFVREYVQKNYFVRWTDKNATNSTPYIVLKAWLVRFTFSMIEYSMCYVCYQIFSFKCDKGSNRFISFHKQKGSYTSSSI